MFPSYLWLLHKKFCFDVCLHVSADIISCVEFNHDGELLATGDKGGRVVIFQRDPIVSCVTHLHPAMLAQIY